MTLPQLIANSGTPGVRTPLTTLGVAVSTVPAAGTPETWTFTAAPPAALAQPGQFTFIVDNEILLDITGGSGTSRTVLRGQEGSTPATHANGSQVWHYLTAGALTNLGSRVQVQFAAHSAAAQLGSSNNVAKVALSASGDYDSGGFFNNASSRFQPGVAGYYLITAGVVAQVALADGDLVVVAVYKNNSALPNGAGYLSAQTGAGTSGLAPQTSVLVYLNGSSDYVELFGECVTSGGIQVAGNFTGWMTGFLASGIGSPSPGQGIQTAARAYRNAGQTLTAATWNKLLLDTPSYDPGSNMDAQVAGNHRYNVPTTGYYQVNANVGVLVESNPQNWVCAVWKNGALLTTGGAAQLRGGTAGDVWEFTFSDILSLVAGDYLELYCYVGAGNAVPINTSGATTNYLSVVQVGGTNLVGALSPTAQSADFTAGAGQCVLMTGAHTVTLPSAPMAGSQVAVVARTGNVSVARAGTDQISNQGAALANSIVILAGANVTLMYLDGVWYVIAGAPQGPSSFLQLPSTMQQVVVAGTSTLTWSTSNAYSNDVTVTHNIGRVPVVALGVPRAVSGNQRIAASLSSINATSFVLGGYALDGTPANGSTTAVNWVAIG